MADNFNSQFEEWKNREKQSSTGVTNENNMTEDIEQVSIDMFDFAEKPEDKQEEADDETDDTRKQEDAIPKVSFAELRHGRKIPRLKKSMVLAIITGGTFMFLFLVNISIQKKEGQKDYFDEQKHNVTVGNDFSLGDLGMKSIPAENDFFVTAEGDGVHFKSPPPYTPIPTHKEASMVTGMNNITHRAHYSDSDLLAINAQIGKEGGYGLAFESTAYAGYANYNPPETRGQIPSREEYTGQRLNDIIQLTQMSSGEQAGNTDRINTGRYTEAGKYNPANTQAGSDLYYLNDNCLFPGVIIHAVLVSRIDTDYPGPIHARVTENVYDSMTGKNLLIPQGTVLQGNYSSSSIGIAKVQIAWESMVVNYGGVAYQVSLGGMAGVDKRGRAGIAGTLDDHYFEWLKAAGIMSLFSMLNSEVAYQTKGQSNPQIRELMDINQGIVNRVEDKLIERALDIQPTVRVANGTAVSVSVNTVVRLRPFPAIKAEEKWIRR